jgi:hypothetical protein
MVAYLYNDTECAVVRDLAGRGELCSINTEMLGFREPIAEAMQAFVTDMQINKVQIAVARA